MAKGACSIDQAMIDFAEAEGSQQVAERLRIIKQRGSIRKACEEIGISREALGRQVARLRNRMARQGYSPEHDMTRPVPDGFRLGRHSQYYDADGKPGPKWVIATPDDVRQREILVESVRAMCEDIKPEKPVSPPKQSAPHLLNQYVVTDYHLGMLSWPEETGADWNTDIAEQMLVDWFGAAINTSPDADTAIFAQLGDFLHWDGLDAVTPTNRHILDADTRFQNIVRSAIRVIRRVISMLLSKHQRVHVIMAEGNHDMASSIWLRELLCSLYDQEPRITIDTNPDPYYCFQFGKTTLFYHHGHKKRFDGIETVFVAKFKGEFGSADHVYGHMGHLHHRHQKETNLMIMEQHRTLASPDSHASRGGFMSGREASVITYHDQHGEVGRVTIKPEMLTQ